MPDQSVRPSRKVARSLVGSAFPLAAALIAVLLGMMVPLVSPLLIALALGVVVANMPGSRSRQLGRAEPTAKSLLRWGVVGLGFRISAGDLASLGLVGVLVVGATVAVTFWATIRLGQWLGVDRALVTLVATGFSICGAAAIAAVSDVIRSRQRDVGLAVALVTVFGSAVMVALPLTVPALGLDDRQAAIWAGASIHEVAQVVGAASLIGPAALASATAVKLARVVMLAPLMALIVARAGMSSPDRAVVEQSKWRPNIPWFVAGFLLAAAIRSTGVVPVALLDGFGQLTVVFLAAGMFGMGLGIRLRELWPLSSRALLLACMSTGVALIVPLLILLALA